MKRPHKCLFLNTSTIYFQGSVVGTLNSTPCHYAASPQSNSLYSHTCAFYCLNVKASNPDQEIFISNLYYLTEHGRVLDQAWLATQFCSPEKLRTSQAFWALTWFCSSDAEEMWGEKEKWMKLRICDLSLWNLSVCGCCFCFSNVPDTNPSNSTGHTSDTCRVPKDWRGSFDVGIKNMVWNVRGELSSRLTSTPFSWPSSCAIRVLICKEAINLGEKEANRPQMWGPEPL